MIDCHRAGQGFQRSLARCVCGYAILAGESLHRRDNHDGAPLPHMWNRGLRRKEGATSVHRLHKIIFIHRSCNDGPVVLDSSAVDHPMESLIGSSLKDRHLNL
jgi:hypothetical protein